MSLVNTIATVFATTALFIFATHKFTKQVEQLEGEKLKGVLTSLSDSPWRSTLLGVIFATLLQSSTATVVATSSLVNAGLLSWIASVSLVIGANVGSSIATHILSYHSIYIAAYLLIVGTILGAIPSRLRKFGKAIFYFGLMFFCLSLMGNFVEPLQASPIVQNILSKISGLPVAILVGMLVTIFLQSSSVVNGLAIVFVAGGILGVEPGVGLLLGAGIGATSTAVIAAYFYNKHARRTVAAHVVYNILGLLIAYPFLHFIFALVNGWGSSPASSVASVYLIFNLFTAIIFLIFLRPFTRLIHHFVK
jgi:phosphate:Na+ symporter